MIFYPYFSPILMTDDTYVFYGGATGTSTAGQNRQAVYLVAEKRMTSHLGTFLKPTIVTGTFSWPTYPDHLVLPYSPCQPDYGGDGTGSRGVE